MFKNQKLAFEKLKELKVGALFMKMGTGKTKVAIEIVNYMDINYLLYICPFSAKSNIQSEINKWGVKVKYDIIGYETLQSSDKTYLECISKCKKNKTFIIADESIFIKNDDTKRFKRLLQLRDFCDYALILNGTPITKNEWDLYNQMYFLSPLIINMNRQEFLNSFFTHIKYKKSGQKPKEFYKFSKVNAEHLAKLINPYIFECDLDFQKKISTQYIYVNYNGEDYENEKIERLSEFQHNLNSEEIILMLNNLNIIASLNELKLKKVCEYSKDKKVIIYCTYLKEIEYIKNNINCYVFTGETKNREQIIEKFKNDNIPLVMTFGVGSMSLNLQFCKEIVFSSLNFDFGKIEQSKYRIKRIGQEKDIKYTYILSDLGITKLIIDNLEKKQTLSNVIKNKIEKGDIEKWIKNL